MSFEDLTREQQSFIRKYFKTGRRWKKEKKAQFNVDLKVIAVRVYSREKELREEIVDLNEEFGEYARGGTLHKWLNETITIFENILKENAEQMKKNMIFPDLGEVYGRFEDIKKAIDNEEKLAEEKKERARTGQANKADMYEKYLNMILDHYIESESLFTNAIAAMQKFPEDKIKERNEKITAYRNAYKRYAEELENIKETDESNEEVNLKTFEFRLNSVYLGNFLVTVNPLISKIKELMEAPSVDSESYLEENSAKDYVERETKRMEEAEKRLVELNGKIKLQKKSLEELKNSFKEAVGGSKDSIREEIIRLNEHIGNLKSEKGQLETFKNGQDARVQKMYETGQWHENVKKQAEELAKKLDEEAGLVTSFEDFDTRLSDEKNPIFKFPTESSIKEKHEELKKRVEDSSEQEMAVVKVYSGEDSLMEISSEQAETLNKMLANALTLIENGNLEYASLLLHDVRNLHNAFMSVNRDGLPAPSDPPLDPSLALFDKLKVLEGKARDLMAQGVMKDYVEDDVKPLRDKVEERKEELKDEPVVSVNDYKTVSEAIDLLEETLNNVVVDTEPSERAKSAKKTVKKLNKSLLKLYRTEEIDCLEADKIPKDQLLRVGDTCYKIKHKTVGSKDMTERKNKDVPREMMDFLKSRSDTLNMMSQITAKGCDELIETYEKETLKLIEEIAKGGETYKEINSIIKYCDKLFEKKPLNEFLPEGYGKVKTEWDKFKKDYAKKLPSKMLEEAKDHRTKIRQLRDKSSDVKNTYEEGLEAARAIFLDIISYDEIGHEGGTASVMSGLINGGAESLVSKYPDQENEQLKEALQKIQSAKEIFSTNSYSTNNIEGEWRDELNLSHRLLECKTHEGVSSGKRQINDLELKIQSYKEEYSKVSTLNEEELLKFILKTADYINKMATGADVNAKAKVEAERLKEKIGNGIKALKKELPKKSANPMVENAKAKLKSMKDRLKSEWKEVEGRAMWSKLVSEYEKLEDELNQLNEDLFGVSMESENIEKMKVSDKRFKQLTSSFSALEDQAHGLVEKEITVNLTEDQKLTLGEDHTKGILKKVHDSLQKVETPDLNTLKGFAETIDNAIDNRESEDTKETRIEYREKALAELRKISGFFNRHPAVQLYGENPFDSGRKLLPLKSALHQVEIAVLNCVSPREKD